MAIGVLHLVGFSTGVALYAMLLWLALADRRAGGRGESLAAVTGLLGMLWNLGSLAAYVLEQMQNTRAAELLAVASYSALGFLPAAVVHSVLRSEAKRSRATRVLILTAYAMSIAGAMLQFSATVFGVATSHTALRILTMAFVALVVPIIAVTRRRFRLERTGWIASLAIFAISGFHLSERHIGEYSWGLELLGHHASLPLAFAILFFDYRFALADLFLKRALTLVVMVTSVSLLFAAIPAITGQTDLRDAATLSMLVLVATLGMLAYPVVRSTVFSFIDRVILRRADYATVLREISRVAAEAETPERVLEGVVEHAGAAVAAIEARWSEDEHGAIGRTGVERHVAVNTAEPPRYTLVIGSLANGRRLLSDDLEMLDAAALIAARRIDALRLMQERIAQGAREQELSKLSMEAELRALRAQIQPHFLFNALNTIGSLIRSSPDKAFDTLLRLTALLRGVLRSSGPIATLEDEMKLIESYLEVERARFEERLRVEVAIPRTLLPATIPTLLLQPLVENAIKHGISPQRRGGTIAIEASADHTGDRPRLVLRVRDDGAGATDLAVRRGRREGVGLQNVEERLRVHYGDDAALSIESAPGLGTVVTATMPLQLAPHAARPLAAGE
ncbi:MAG TPA: sensor histidine kinase [Thermoanaerobaculia bacterium]